MVAGSSSGSTLMTLNVISALPLTSTSPLGLNAKHVPGKACASLSRQIVPREVVERMWTQRSDVLNARCLPFSLFEGKLSTLSMILSMPKQLKGVHEPKLKDCRWSIGNLFCFEKSPLIGIPAGDEAVRHNGQGAFLHTIVQGHLPSS